jgi:hypothetical protein
MADVPFTVIGFPGQVGDVEEAQRHAVSTPPFMVASAADWAISADVSAPLQVLVSAGVGAVAGGSLRARTTQVATLNPAPNTTLQDRYDAVVAVFNWQTPKGVSFRVVPGAAAPPQVNPSLTAVLSDAMINRYMGVRYDGLLGVVKVRAGLTGALSAGDVIPLAPWGSATGGAVNVGSAQYLTLLDAPTGALVRSVNSDILWSRLASGWGFEKWVGSDKTRQPMISLRNLTMSVPSNAVTTVTWPEQLDHGTQGGVALLSRVGNNIRCNFPGRVRVDAYTFSDLGSPGWSQVAVSMLAGGGNFINSMDNLGQRQVGYGGAGMLRQMVPSGPFQVNPNDLIGMILQQFNDPGATVPYQTYLSATYV